MDILSGDISALVFRRVVREDTGEISFDSQMLTIFMEFDGKRHLATVAKKTGLKMSVVREAVNKLMHLDLIELVEDAISALDRDFLDYLRRQLSLAIGPVAEVLIEDAVSDMGYSVERFPSQRAAELVEMLGRDIHREEKKTAFKQSLVSKIKEKGY
jgi:predicted transcriptional regulator